MGRNLKFSAVQMKEHNQTQLYNLVRTEGPISRVNLAKALNMSPTSVGRLVLSLIEDGYLVESGEVEGNIGRKATLLSVLPGRVLAIGINIGTDYIEGGLVNIRGKILLQKKEYFEPHSDYPLVVEQIKWVVDQIFNEITDEQKENVYGIGISIFGPTDYHNGVVLQSPQLGWDNVPLKRMIQNDYEYRVFVENNVKAAAKAERVYCAESMKNDYLMVYLGSGIGTALVLDNRIMRGARNLAGEIGHIVVEPNGEMCDCKRRGCLQATACTRSIEAKMQMPYKEVVRRYYQNDEACMAELDKIATFLSQWVANLANMYDPPEVILYGEMLQGWPELFELIQQRHRRFLWAEIQDGLIIRRSAMDEDTIPLVSAAANAFYDFLKSVKTG